MGDHAFFLEMRKKPFRKLLSKTQHSPRRKSKTGLKRSPISGPVEERIRDLSNPLEKKIAKENTKHNKNSRTKKKGLLHPIQCARVFRKCVPDRRVDLPVTQKHN